jgi:excisionase family DNA binding protein
MQSNGEKLVIGISGLAEKLGVSRPTISEYIRLGMPCGRVGRRWHFHLDNIDKWLIGMTSAKYEGKEDPESLEDQDES